MKPTRKERLDFWFLNCPTPPQTTEWLNQMTQEERHSFFLNYLKKLKEVMMAEELLLREVIRDERHLQKVINVLRTAYLASVDERTRLVIQVTQTTSKEVVSVSA